MATPEGTARMVEVGVFRRPHGLAGEIALSRSSDDDQFPYDVLDVDGRTLTVTGRRRKGNLWLLTFAEVGTKEQAVPLVGRTARVPRTSLPGLPAGQIYLCDVPGMTVADGRGRLLGVAREVLHLAGRDYIELESGHVVPFSPAIVLSIDLEARRMALDVADGLLEV